MSFLSKADYSGFAKLKELSFEHGEIGVCDMIYTQIAEGIKPKVIAENLGVTWLSLRGWLELKPERMAGWNLAKRCLADRLQYEALDDANNGEENVQLAKLKAETKVRLSGKLSREEWGEKVDVSIDQTINIVEVLKEARMRVVESVPLEIEDAS